MITTPPPPGPQTRPRAQRPTLPRGLALAALATAMGVVILDASMVNLALPAMRSGLGLSGAEQSWVATAYLVAFAGLLLLGGRLADVLGGRRVFLAGLAIYTVASAACALAPSGSVLIAARVVQGVGAAVLAPAALSLVLTLYPEAEDRRRALGIWGGAAGAGSLLGVVLGGVVTQTLGWTAVFWLPVPLGVAVAVVVWRAVAPSVLRPGRFDIAGATTITAATSGLALGLISGPQIGWSESRTVISLVAGVAALVAFVVVERRSAQPLVPLTVFRRGPVVIANTVMLLLGAVAVGLFYFLPQYQQQELGMSALTTGLTQLPIAVMITMGGFVAPGLARSIGPRTAMVTATVLVLAGLLWLAPTDTTSGYAIALLGPFLLVGTGLGLGFVYATTTAVAAAGAGEAGLLSGLINAARQLGGAVGLAALVAVASSGAGVAFSTAFLGAAGLALLALLLSLAPAAHRPLAVTG